MLAFVWPELTMCGGLDVLWIFNEVEDTSDCTVRYERNFSFHHITAYMLGEQAAQLPLFQHMLDAVVQQARGWAKLPVH